GKGGVPDSGATRMTQAWQRELSWHSTPVRVRAFMLLPPCHGYINEGPDELIIGKYDPYFYPEPEERNRVLAEVARWEAAGNFVLWWGEDWYRLDPDGRLLPP